MTRAELVGLMGEPAQITFNVHFLYSIHPYTHTHAHAAFNNPKSGRAEDAPLDEHATIEYKNPPGDGEDLPGDFRPYFASQCWDIAATVAFFAIPAVALLSLMPVNLGARWGALPVYYPALALVFGWLYESAQKGGWRFDLFLLMPFYGVIAVAWVIRVAIVARQ